MKVIVGNTIVKLWHADKYLKSIITKSSQPSLKRYKQGNQYVPSRSNNHTKIVCSFEKKYFFLVKLKNDSFSSID